MTRIFFVLIYIACYVVWLFYKTYGWIPLLVFQGWLVLGIINEYFAYNKITNNLIKLYYAELPDYSWEVLRKFGHAIYSPLGSESIAVSFSASRFIGLIFLGIFIYQSRYIEAIILAVNFYLLGLLAGWLDPVFFMSHFGRKDPKYALLAEIVSELKEFVRWKSMEL